jgi:Nuclease-related domain
MLAGRVPVREVAAWWAGARGEEHIGRLLAPLRHEGFVVLYDVDTGRGDIDHVVIGPTGVFVIETKAWQGRVYPQRGGRLMCSGVDRSAALLQAKAEALEVRDRLGRAGMPCRVEAAIALAFTQLRMSPLRFGPVWVLNSEDLRRHITTRDHVLRPDRVRRAVDANA